MVLEEHVEEFQKIFLLDCRRNNLDSRSIPGLDLGSRSREQDLVYNFPCSAVIVMNEIYCFINGQTKEEFEHCIFGDDSEARRISNYYKIRGIFERILPSPLLSAHTGCEFLRTDTAADLIKNSVNPTMPMTK